MSILTGRVQKRHHPPKSLQAKDSSGSIKNITFGETRVVLVGGNYIPTAHFPVWGSNKQQVGTITNLDARFGTNLEDPGMVVLWDNGERNDFKLTLLLIVDEERKSNPNFGFRIDKFKSKEEDENEMSKV